MTWVAAEGNIARVAEKITESRVYYKRNGDGTRFIATPWTKYIARLGIVTVLYEDRST